MGKRYFQCDVGKRQASLNRFEALMQHLCSSLLDLLEVPGSFQAGDKEHL